ncbi:MAG: DUF4465 domain-containing protein [Bacteroidales bacterium]|nr:DUF4465 domain-containing protein [Bacteroidales bacterium]
MKKLLLWAVAALCLFVSCTVEKEHVSTYVVNFEGAGWDALIDSPQYGGDLLYGPMAEDYTYYVNYSWMDPCGLGFKGFREYYGSVCFMSGGEAISNYVMADYSGADYTKQLAVPVLSAANGKNFAVHNGDGDGIGLEFNSIAERKIISMDVCMTSYLAAGAINGDDFFAGLTADDSYVGVVATGFDSSDNIIGEVKFNLITGAEAKAIKAGTRKIEWKTVDMTPLGNAFYIDFKVIASSDCYGEYGLNAPKYFAYDNIVVEERRYDE